MYFISDYWLILNQRETRLLLLITDTDDDAAAAAHPDGG